MKENFTWIMNKVSIGAPNIMRKVVANTIFNLLAQTCVYVLQGVGAKLKISV